MSSKWMYYMLRIKIFKAYLLKIHMTHTNTYIHTVIHLKLYVYHYSIYKLLILILYHLINYTLYSIEFIISTIILIKNHQSNKL